MTIAVGGGCGYSRTSELRTNWEMIVLSEVSVTLKHFTINISQ